MWRLLTLVLALVTGLLMIRSAANAQNLGPFCSTAEPPLNQVFELILIPTTAANWIIQGTVSSPTRVVDGKFTTEKGPAQFDFTISAGKAPNGNTFAHALVGGTVNLQTLEAEGLCQGFGGASVSCPAAGILLRFRPVPCS